MDSAGFGAQLDLCEQQGLVPALVLFYLISDSAGIGQVRRAA
jgi:hypothetical protein